MDLFIQFFLGNIDDIPNNILRFTVLKGSRCVCGADNGRDNDACSPCGSVGQSVTSHFRLQCSKAGLVDDLILMMIIKL